jgi:predicted DNA binding CopG/RHH family protein
MKKKMKSLLTKKLKVVFRVSQSEFQAITANFGTKGRPYPVKFRER